MPSLKLVCTQCQTLMAVEMHLAGHRVRCPKCKFVLRAPTAPEEAPAFVTDDPSSIFAEFAEHTPLPDHPPKRPDVPAETAFASLGPDRTAPARRPHAAASEHRVREWLLAISLPYAVLMTAVAIYYYYQYRTAVQLHPLEMIPDVFGEHKQTPGKGGQVLRLPPPDAELPRHLRTALGVPLTVGQIEVTPLGVEQRPVSVLRAAGPGTPEAVAAKKESLVLRLRLRNLSADIAFHPTDPFFVRTPRDKFDRPYALVEVGPQKFYGGPLEYRPSATREWLAGQEADASTLPPGEARETIVATHPADPVIEAVRRYDGPVVWRLHVRRGLTTFHGRAVPVSAVVGVEFTAADVRKPAGG